MLNFLCRSQAVRGSNHPYDTNRVRSLEIDIGGKGVSIFAATFDAAATLARQARVLRNFENYRLRVKEMCS